jgi:opacity protein-like surface antigen
MNRTSLVLALALSLGTAAVAQAQDTPTPATTTSTSAAGVGSIVIGPTLGFSLPFGDFADRATIGFNLGVIGDYYAAPNWAFGGEISWHTFGGNDDLEKELSAAIGEPVDLKLRVLPIVGHVKYFIPAAGYAPYVRGGIGLFNLSSEIEAGSESSDDSDTNLGFLFGGGVNFNGGSRVSYGAEAYYQYISTEGDATNMLVIRGNFLFGVR